MKLTFITPSYKTEVAKREFGDSGVSCRFCVGDECVRLFEYGSMYSHLIFLADQYLHKITASLSVVTKQFKLSLLTSPFVSFSSLARLNFCVRFSNSHLYLIYFEYFQHNNKRIIKQESCVYG